MKNTRKVLLLACVVLLALFSFVACDDGECKEHTFGEWTAFIPATCENGGVDKRVCTVCQDEDIRTVDPLGHDEVNYAAKAPTCTEGGWDAYVECSRCDYSTKAEKAKLEHDTVTHAGQAPSCTEKGWDAYETCKNCAHSTYEEKPALNHNLTTHEGKAPTCTEGGFDAYEECSRCDYSTYEEKPALDHDLTSYPAKAPTATEVGWDAYEACSRCDYSTYVELAAGHDLVYHEGKSATCTEDGYRPYYTCSRCDYTTYQVLPAGHTLQSHIAKAPTCTAIGWDAYVTCTKCTYTTYMEKAALGHDEIEHEGKAATCLEGGYADYVTCSRCDYTTYKEQSALGHDKVKNLAKAPTCTEKGWDEYLTCTRCDYTTYVEKAALGHNEVAHEAQDPTCTDIGWDAYVTCSRCDYTTYKEQGALGHDKVRTLAKAPTCTESGWDEYITCTRCDYTTYVEKAKLGHDEIKHDGKAATCSESGWDAYVTCSRCDYTTYQILPAGHILQTHIAKAPTCTESGWDAYEKCSRCDYTTYRERPTLPHNYNNRTCTACGAAIPYADNLDSYGDSLDFSSQEDFVISYFDLYGYEVYGDERSTEKLDTLIYNRNKLIEARFGVEISQQGKIHSTGANDLTSHYNYVQGALNSGDVPFDAVAMYAYNAGKLILGNGGNFLDWRSEIPYCKDSIKAAEEWWPEGINRASTVMGKQFVAVSDFCITAMEMTYAVIFNKDLAKNENVAYNFDPATYTIDSTLYDLVRNNDWHLESMKTIVKDFYRDNPTTGMRGERDIEDRFGLVAPGGTDADAWAHAFGYNYVQNDGVSTPELWNMTSSLVSTISSLRELYQSTGTWNQTVGQAIDDYNGRTKFFSRENRVLFQLNTLESLKWDVIHNMEQDFGVLPYPKYDQNQAKHLTGSLDHYTVLAVPYATAWDSERLRMTGALIEALSAENCNSVKDAYYENLVTHHNVTDADAVEMINIIMDGRAYDLGVYHYNELMLVSDDGDSSAFALFFRYLIRNPNKDIVQYWEANRGSLENQMNSLLNKYSYLMW